MERQCDVCGETYPAKRATSKYCSTRCRTRASRGQVVPIKAEKPAGKPKPAGGAGPVERATVKELTDAERLDSALGQACIVLARRLDAPGADTGSAVSSVAARLEDLLAKATRGAKGAATAPQSLADELAERRKRHGA